MLHRVTVVEHHHQRDNGKLATGTGCQLADASLGIGLDGLDKRHHIARFNGFTCYGVHLAGIIIGGIVGEVATDDKEVFVREIGF